MGPVEKHQFLLAESFANPDELNECALANWTFSTGPMSLRHCPTDAVAPLTNIGGWSPPSLFSWSFNDLVATAGAQRLQLFQRKVLSHEACRAVREGEIGAARGRGGNPINLGLMRNLERCTAQTVSKAPSRRFTAQFSCVKKRVSRRWLDGTSDATSGILGGDADSA